MMKVITVMHLNFQMFLSLKVLQYLSLLGMLFRWLRKKLLLVFVLRQLVPWNTEKCFRRMLASTNGRLPQGKGIPDVIA